MTYNVYIRNIDQEGALVPFYFAGPVPRNRSSPARLRGGGWGLAGAGAGVPQRPVTVMFV